MGRLIECARDARWDSGARMARCRRAEWVCIPTTGCVFPAARIVPRQGRAPSTRRRACAYSPTTMASALASVRKASLRWEACVEPVREDSAVTVGWAGWSDACQTRIHRLPGNASDVGQTPTRKRVLGLRTNANAMRDSREMRAGNVPHVSLAPCTAQTVNASLAHQANIASANCTTSHALEICFHTRAQPSAAPAG
jgi:hypothetical protein